MRKICVEPHSPVGWHTSVGCFRVSVHARGKSPDAQPRGPRRRLRPVPRAELCSPLLSALASPLPKNLACCDFWEPCCGFRLYAFLCARRPVAGWQRVFCLRAALPALSQPKNRVCAATGRSAYRGGNGRKNVKRPFLHFRTALPRRLPGGQAGGGFPPVLCRHGRPDGEKR